MHTSVRRNRRTNGRHIARSGLIFLFGLLLSSFILTCSGKEERKATDPAPTEQCGECLSAPTRKVCTARGNIKNACLAICRGIKIECYQACPCPAPEK